IEYWIRPVQIDDVIWMLFNDKDGTFTDSIYLWFGSDGNIWYSDDTGDTAIQAYTANTWYHFNIFFDCSTGTYDLWIDGFQKLDDADIRGNVDAIDYLWINSVIQGSWTPEFYLDDFGYSSYEWLINTGFSPITVMYTYAGIVEELEGHKTVLELYDNNGNYPVSTNYTFSETQSFGTIEHWVRISDANKQWDLSLFGGGEKIFGFEIDDNVFWYWDGYSESTGLSATSNRWYHIRYDFESTNGNYKGLTQYSWVVYIDGIKYGPYDFYSNQSFADKISLQSNSSDSNYFIYFDGFGFSWDPDYSLGDNIFDFDVQSLIQAGFILFGPASEYDYNNYPGTFSFINDTVGSNPAGFITNEAGTSTIDVIESSDEHEKVVKFHYQDANINIEQNFASPQMVGSIEWWSKSGQMATKFHMRFFSAGIELFNVFYGNYGEIKWTDSLGMHVAKPYAPNVWYHSRIDFDSYTDTFDFYLDGMLYGGGGYSYMNPDDGNGVDKGKWTTNGFFGDYYVDAIGYSWDPNYNIGDNIIPIYVPSNTVSSGYGPNLYVSTESSVLELSDNNYYDFINIRDPFSDMTTGVVEFLWATNDKSKFSVVNLNQDNSTMVSLMIRYGEFQYFEGIWKSTGINVSDNQFYTHKILIDCVTDNFIWYIDEFAVASGSFKSNADYINELY
ncbi:hypothetical protein LCGC14_2115830, partial [marine sediment metagenome]